MKPAITVKRSVAGFAILLGIYLIYVAVRLIFLGNASNAALDQLDSLQHSSKPADLATLSTAVDNLADDVSAASSIANDPLLAPLKIIPGLGKDFAAVADLTAAGDYVLVSAEPLLSSAQVLAEAQDSGTTGAKWGAFQSSAAATLGTRFVALEQAVEQASTTVADLADANLDFGLNQKLEPLNAQLRQAATGLHNLQPLVSVMGPVLAQRQPTTWFIATQNLAEARATGGILGSFAVISVDRGKIKLVTAGSDQDLANFGKVNYSSLPAEVRSLWGVDNRDWRDMNASLHLPYFGQQLADSFAKVKKIDGVLFMGQGTVSQLVAATGSMNVDGVEINAANTSDFLAKGIYARYSSVSKKNAWVVSFMHTLFGRLAGQSVDLPGMWQAATSANSGDRLAAWSADAKVEAAFADAQVAGDVNDALGSTTYFSINNAGGNKLDAYLKLKAKYSLGRCGQLTDFGFQGREAGLTLKLTNSAPKRGLPAYVTPRLDSLRGQSHKVGSNRELVSIYAPVGATFTEFTLDGDLVNATEGVDRGHPVWVLDVELNPGQTSELKALWVEPITDNNGREHQTDPQLIAPVALNSIATSVNTTGFCSVSK